MGIYDLAYDSAVIVQETGGQVAGMSLGQFLELAFWSKEMPGT